MLKYNLRTFSILLLLFIIAFQVMSLMFLEIYPEKMTIIKWYNLENGIFENLAMRIDNDGTFKATYSFIYLLPVYIFFTLIKLFNVESNLAIALSNFFVLNIGFILLLLTSYKLYRNFINSIIFFAMLFFSTFAWTGIQRILPHDVFFIIILIMILKPSSSFFFKPILVYLEPIFGSFAITFKFILTEGIKKNLFKKFLISVLFPISLGILIWSSIILILIFSYDFTPHETSIFKRSIGRDDPYFFSRLQVFTPFSYYFPLYIQSSFTSLKYGLIPFAFFVNFFSPIILTIFWYTKDKMIKLIKHNDQFMTEGLSICVSYLFFVIVFGQAAASHRFDYDQFFQFGILLMVISLSNYYPNILNYKMTRLLFYFVSLIVIPYISVQIFLKNF